MIQSSKKFLIMDYIYLALKWIFLQELNLGFEKKYILEFLNLLNKYN